MQFDDFKFGVYIIIAIKDSIANFWLDNIYSEEEMKKSAAKSSFASNSTNIFFYY